MFILVHAEFLQTIDILHTRLILQEANGSHSKLRTLEQEAFFQIIKLKGLLALHGPKIVALSFIHLLTRTKDLSGFFAQI